MNRTDKAAKNGMFGMISFMLQAFISIYTQRLFIKFLGYEILGLNTIFYTIINTLNVAELGIGSAIVFSLYRPLAENNKPKISALIQLYKKIYRIIGFFVLIAGITLIPFLSQITNFPLHSYLLPYLIILFNAVISYLFTFNQTLLLADQNNYIVSISSAVSKISYNIIQILVLYFIPNYVLYVLSNVIFSIGNNIVQWKIVKHKYPYLTTDNIELDKEEKITIKKNVIALIYHKLGNYLVQGTDNIIISMFINITSVGLYSNYTLIGGSITALLNSIFSGFISGFGNLIVTADTEHQRTVFKRACMLNNIIYGIVSVGTFISINAFLEFVYGGGATLPLLFLLLFSLNFYLTGYGTVAGNLRAAAGLYNQDKYINIVIPVVNLGISILLVKYIGVSSVLAGTLFCLLIKESVIVPFICYKYIFKKRVFPYYLMHVRDIFVCFISATIAYLICGLIVISNPLLRFFVYGALSVLVTGITMFLVYSKTDEFKYCVSIFTGIFAKLGYRFTKIEKE